MNRTERAVIVWKPQPRQLEFMRRPEPEAARIAAAWFMSCTMTAAAGPYFFEGISLKNNSNAVGVPICGVFLENGWIRA